jgi:hypothetical protein
MKTYERKLKEGWVESLLLETREGVNAEDFEQDTEPPFFEQEIEIVTDSSDSEEKTDAETEEVPDRPQTPPPGKTKTCNNCQKAGKKCKFGRPCARCISEGLNDCADGIDMRKEKARKRKETQEDVEEDGKSEASEEELSTPRETRSKKRQKKEPTFSPWTVPNDSPQPPPAYDSSASHSDSEPQFQSAGSFKPSPKEKKQNPILLALAEVCDLDPSSGEKKILAGAAAFIASVKGEKEEFKTQLLAAQALLESANTEVFELRDFKEKAQDKEKKLAGKVKGLEEEHEQFAKTKEAEITQKREELVKLSNELSLKSRELEEQKKTLTSGDSTSKERARQLAAKTKEFEELKTRFQTQEQELRTAVQKVSEQKGCIDGLMIAIQARLAPQIPQHPQTVPIYYHTQGLQALQALGGQSLMRYVAGAGMV